MSRKKIKKKTLQDCWELFRNVPKGYIMGIRIPIIDDETTKDIPVRYVGYDEIAKDTDNFDIKVDHLYFVDICEETKPVIKVYRNGKTGCGDQLILMPVENAIKTPITWDAFYETFSKSAEEKFIDTLKKGDILCCTEDGLMSFTVFSKKTENADRIYASFSITIDLKKYLVYRKGKCNFNDVITNVKGVDFTNDGFKTCFCGRCHIANANEESILLNIIKGLMNDCDDAMILTPTEIEVHLKTPINFTHKNFNALNNEPCQDK